jgi:L-asparaginase/Glu-tRNA(Gln) amidotransferase subunit D
MWLSPISTQAPALASPMPWWRGAKGIVVASVGAGAPGPLGKELLEIIKKRSAVVVVSSRVGEGRIVRNNNWDEPGMVAADTLSPQKAAQSIIPRTRYDAAHGA